ncbi:MAG: lytic transglycosylase, LysM and LysM [Deltaproteobacteria bacterium]|nr:lytic transglycosylase, LysM and LysM [Deltaproteobacteria bacterium]
MHKFSLRPADPSLSMLDARLAALVIPDPPEMTALAPQSPLEIPPNPGVEAAIDPVSRLQEWIPLEDASAFALQGGSGEENAATKEIPSLLSKSTPRESEGTLPAEKKRILAPQKSAKSPGRTSGSEPSHSDPLAKKGMDKPVSEKPATPSISAAGSFLSGSEPQDLPSPPWDFLAETEGKTQVLDWNQEPSLELSGNGAKTSARSAVHSFPSLSNEKVQDFISHYQGRGESFFSRSLARSQAYEGMMKRIFREKNLPEDLFYLALIESGYNPTALSRAKASGIWQFISQTAKRFGLRIDKWVDERRDPEKSTLAAAEYLKTLHGMFNNWDLATAGYNAGEAKILTAMRKAQSDDFWEISNHRYLKQETKKYVPQFLAAMTIAKEPQKYGFSNIEYHPPLVYEKVAVPPSTSLALIARAAETDLSEIRSLNPALLREKTPPNLPQFEINLPPGKKEVFQKNFPSLSRASATKDGYRVRSGDTLSHLGKKFNVSVQELCGANALTPQTLLKPGSILKIPR